MRDSALTISLIGAPTDIGAGSRGASMGPEALRVAGLQAALESRGLAVTDRGNLNGPRNPWLPAVNGYRHLAEVVAWNRTVHDAVHAELQAGCLPILLQIPVFFSLYKVLFVTIEMRHAPFFGWIKDLSAPDPTNLFTLFGLLHFDPTQLPMIGHYLALGIWPIIMGITMWFQMKLNPTPPDPTQQMIFAWMPLIFTFMLAGFPAGLVIYWAWNNTLSVLQQSFIMRRNGVKVELFDNIRGTFGSKKAESKT